MTDTRLPLTIDLDDLTLALGSLYELDDPAHYLDRQTGQVLYAGEGLEDLPADLKDNARYVWIEPRSGEASLAQIEQFVAAIPDKLVRDVLTVAVQHDEPLEAFMAALPAFPAWRDAWVRAQHETGAQEALTWCHAHGIEPTWI